MKRITSLLLLMLLLNFCAGCDGYIKALYLLKPNDPKPSGSINRKLISIQGSEDIPGIVLQVSKDLGMKEDNGSHWYWSVETFDQSRFSMQLKKSENDVWTVILLDWPTIHRSDKSKLAEDKISELLKKAQQGR